MFFSELLNQHLHNTSPVKRWHLMKKEGWIELGIRRHCEQYNGREINQTNSEANKGLSPSEGSAGSSRVLATQAAPPCCSPWLPCRHPPATQRRPTFHWQTEHAADIWFFNPDNIWWHQSGGITPPLPPRWHSWFLWSSTRSGHLSTPSLRSLYCKLFFFIIII